MDIPDDVEGTELFETIIDATMEDRDEILEQIASAGDPTLRTALNELTGYFSVLNGIHEQRR